MRPLLVALAILMPPIAPAAGQTIDDDLVATLYRSSAVIAGARFHVATFDADPKSISTEAVFEHNWANCTTAAELLQSQPGVRVRFWCERGRDSRG